ncbi:Exopolysaccharide synthesis, ExoD, partial [Desulfonatronum zhilinae]
LLENRDRKPLTPNTDSTTGENCQFHVQRRRAKHFWLPFWLLQRSVAHNRLEKALKFSRPYARVIDRWLRPRLTILVRRTGTYFIALFCIFIAVGLPAMELVPFLATSAGVALTILGLSLVVRDGFLALLAYIFTAATTGLVISHFL